MIENGLFIERNSGLENAFFLNTLFPRVQRVADILPFPSSDTLTKLFLLQQKPVDLTTSMWFSDIMAYPESWPIMFVRHGAKNLFTQQFLEKEHQVTTVTIDGISTSTMLLVPEYDPSGYAEAVYRSNVGPISRALIAKLANL